MDFVKTNCIIPLDYIIRNLLNSKAKTKKASKCIFKSVMQSSWFLVIKKTKIFVAKFIYIRILYNLKKKAIEKKI